MVNNNSINGRDPLLVTKGGTGLSTITDHSVMIGSGTGAVTPITVGGTGELLVGAAGADPAFGTSAAGDFTFTTATAGATRALSVTNTDNSNTSSNAQIQATVGGTSGGDPYINFLITGSTTYSIGPDNSVSTDPLKFTDGADPSTGNILASFFPTINSYRFGYGQNSNNNRIWSRNTGTTDAGACIVAGVGSASTGDAWFTCELEAAQSFCFGIDNSDSDKLKINSDPASDVTPSNGTNFWTMTTAGERTMPLQPAFLAYLNATASNVTGDGTVYDIVYDRETYDQNADFNTTTGVFTAPVTGKYHFDVTLYLSGIDSGHTKLICYLTAPGALNVARLNPYAMLDGDGNLCLTFSRDVTLTATQTAKVQLYVAATNKTVDVIGTSNAYSTFSGHLVC